MDVNMQQKNSKNQKLWKEGESPDSGVPDIIS